MRKSVKKKNAKMWRARPGHPKEEKKVYELALGIRRVVVARHFYKIHSEFTVNGNQ